MTEIFGSRSSRIFNQEIQNKGVTMNTKLSLDQIAIRAEVEGYTGYQLWRILDAKLRAEGLEGWKRPQQVYNYDRNGMIVKGQKNVSRDRKFTKEEVDTFVEIQIEKAKIKAEVKIDIQVPAESEVEVEVEGQLTMMDLIDEDVDA
jgi:hypothetical protein